MKVLKFGNKKSAKFQLTVTVQGFTIRTTAKRFADVPWEGRKLRVLLQREHRKAISESPPQFAAEERDYVVLNGEFNQSLQLVVTVHLHKDNTFKPKEYNIYLQIGDDYLLGEGSFDLATYAELMSHRTTPCSFELTPRHGSISKVNMNCVIAMNYTKIGNTSDPSMRSVWSHRSSAVGVDDLEDDLARREADFAAEEFEGVSLTSSASRPATPDVKLGESHSKCKTTARLFRKSSDSNQVLNVQREAAMQLSEKDDVITDLESKVSVLSARVVELEKEVAVWRQKAESYAESQAFATASLGAARPHGLERMAPKARRPWAVSSVEAAVVCKQ
eukprot:Colp12_sorted_trinity150504_noHs@11922